MDTQGALAPSTLALSHCLAIDGTYAGVVLCDDRLSDTITFAWSSAQPANQRASDGNTVAEAIISPKAIAAEYIPSMRMEG